MCLFLGNGKNINNWPKGDWKIYYQLAGDNLLCFFIKKNKKRFEKYLEIKNH